MNHTLGRSGLIEKQTEYWGIASYFEVAVLAGDYVKACAAAERMAMVKPPVW